MDGVGRPAQPEEARRARLVSAAHDRQPGAVAGLLGRDGDRLQPREDQPRRLRAPHLLAERQALARPGRHQAHGRPGRCRRPGRERRADPHGAAAPAARPGAQPLTGPGPDRDRAVRPVRAPLQVRLPLPALGRAPHRPAARRRRHLRSRPRAARPAARQVRAVPHRDARRALLERARRGGRARHRPAGAARLPGPGEPERPHPRRPVRAGRGRRAGLVVHLHQRRVADERGRHRLGRRRVSALRGEGRGDARHAARARGLRRQVRLQGEDRPAQGAPERARPHGRGSPGGGGRAARGRSPARLVGQARALQQGRPVDQAGL